MLCARLYMLRQKNVFHSCDEIKSCFECIVVKLYLSTMFKETERVIAILEDDHVGIHVIKSSCINNNNYLCIPVLCFIILRQTGAIELLALAVHFYVKLLSCKNITLQSFSDKVKLNPLLWAIELNAFLVPKN